MPLSESDVWVGESLDLEGLTSSSPSIFLAPPISSPPDMGDNSFFSSSLPLSALLMLESEEWNHMSKILLLEWLMGQCQGQALVVPTSIVTEIWRIEMDFMPPNTAAPVDNTSS